MTQTMRTIACVIPTHLRGAYLTEAVESALAQTLAPQVVIVVSDVKDDDARSAITSIANSTEIDVRYVERLEGPQGASGSRNAGAAIAGTDILAFLDDDDLWEPTHLERALSVLQGDGVDLSVPWMIEFSENHARDWHAPEPGLSFEEVVAQNPGVTGSGIVVTRRAFEALEGFDPKLPVKNDTDFLARFLQAGYDYGVVRERLVRQRQHQLGQLTGVTERRAAGTEAYIAKHSKSLSPKNRRLLVQSVHRIRSHSAETLPRRLYHLARVATLHSPLVLFRKIVTGREKVMARVRGGRDGN
ncbi:glycosyltransferase family 2 protein [Pseudoclavibacter helvolus]|uniref:glycosyltransferase family 2 protein n=1 Tax=Pseudoclavibacter helvolus TaxID=255205 RepID=UPI003736DFE0